MKYYICITPFFPYLGHIEAPYIYHQVKTIEHLSDYKVIVLRPRNPWSHINDYEYEGIKVYYFNSYSLPSNIWPNDLSDWSTSKGLINKLQTIGIDVNDVAFAHSHVIRQGAFANALKQINPNIITIVQHHGLDVMGITDGILAKYNFHKRHCIRHGVRICNQVDLNIGVSNITLECVLRQPGIKLKKQYVLYNGVDISIFYPTATTTNNNEFIIGCIANFWPLKDQITLIKAVEILRDNGIHNVKCIFIGSGVTLQECKQYVTKHNLDAVCEFRKEVEHDKLPDFYRSLDLFVLPSYYEAFGCVYTEAYACGLNFVAVKGQGIEEIIDEEERDKWLIEKGDSVQLSKIIERTMNNKDERMKLCKKWKLNDLIYEYLDYIEKKC